VRPDDGPGRSSRARGAVVLLLVLALMAVVTIAATGSTPGGTGRSTAPSDTLFDTVVSLLIVVFAAGLVAAFYVLVRDKDLQWSTPRARYGLGSLVMFLVTAFAIALYVRSHGLDLRFDPQQAPLDRTENVPPPPAIGGGSQPQHEFRFAWIPVLVVLGLAVTAVAAFVFSSRRRRTAVREPALAAELASAIDVSLDDLRAEPDPRRAVIAAYARLERVLAAHGQPRHASDTPEEHVSRALAALAVDRRAVRRLEELYLHAKFSQHRVDARMKAEAIAALERVRDELRSTEGPGTVPLGMPA
jgi:hypothetical protein